MAVVLVEPILKIEGHATGVVAAFRPHPNEEIAEMPKMKSNSGAAKRFKRSASGRIKRGQSFRSHILTKKSTKRKRQLRNPLGVHEADKSMVKRMLPYL